ncbi:hypothetical protein [Paraburkholderia sp. GAS334]|jgi:hypothetical protein
MIKLDFRADLVEHIDASLKQLGYSPSDVEVARDNVPRLIE